MFGQPPKKAPATEPTPSPRRVLWRPGSSRRSLPITDERFLWSAICSANTTNATGTYATATVRIYFPSTALKPFAAARNEKSGTAKSFIPENTEKSITLKASLPVLIPITVKIAATT